MGGRDEGRFHGEGRRRAGRRRVHGFRHGHGRPDHHHAARGRQPHHLPGDHAGGESQSRRGLRGHPRREVRGHDRAAQGSDIDAVTGATITTAGVRQAVDDALA
ncbi:FMN-binding protein, partial [Eggerthella sinensis]|uniref:FMN-binding protein n=1 Tax=Eggerthella sinensis TaxID=242230 RepID=UPI0022E15035